MNYTWKLESEVREIKRQLEHFERQRKRQEREQFHHFQIGHEQRGERGFTLLKWGELVGETDTYYDSAEDRYRGDDEAHLKEAKRLNLLPFHRHLIKEKDIAWFISQLGEKTFIILVHSLSKEREERAVVRIDTNGANGELRMEEVSQRVGQHNLDLENTEFWYYVNSERPTGMGIMEEFYKTSEIYRIKEVSFI